MYALWKRWSRAGYMPRWFYAVIASGFVSLTIMGIVRGEWLVAVLAAVMIGVTVAAAWYMPRLAHAAEESQRHFYPEERRGGER
jgi:hypothetical protein